MRIDTEQLPVEELLRGVSQREIALPEFQRKFVWRPAQIAELFRTVARKWPSGSFLLMRLDSGAPPFQLKSLQGAPKINPGAARTVVLDGQQRLTSLYQVLHDRSEEIYYLEILRIRAEGFDDDHLKYLKRSIFAKRYPTIKAMASAGIAPIHTVWDDEKFDDWKSYIEDDEVQRDMLRLRKEQLPGLRGYDVPAVVLPNDVDFAAVAKIFETLNKTGTQLDVFDLMVARLYPHDFKLRDEWDQAIKAYPRLDRYAAEGMDVLRILALRDHLSGGRSKGVRKSDVLSLTPEQVKSQWLEAVDALDRSIEFLAEKLGAVNETLLPSRSLLLPVADALWDAKGARPQWKNELEQWCWRAALSNRYAQAANTQAVADARELRSWFHNPSSPPDILSNFSFGRSTLTDLRRRNESVLRALLCLLLKLDARDWISQQRLIDAGAQLDIHHIFPKRYLETIGSSDGDPDVLVNFTLLLKSTNVSLRSDPPSEVVKRAQVDRSAVEGHRVSLPSLETNDWAEFQRSRAQQLEDAIRNRLGILVADNLEE